MPDHLGIVETNAKIALITGNPDRIGVISEIFGPCFKITDRRGFICHEGEVGGVPILIVAAGIGAPSTAIVIEELVELGVTCIIRLGTCGALAPDIKVGDLIIPSGAIREDGTSIQYIDPQFPAVPDFEFLRELVLRAKGSSIDLHVGIVHSKDAYYLERAEKQLLPESSDLRWEKWRRAGTIATEMECSLLFVLGSLRRVRTAAILVAVGGDLDEGELRASFVYALHSIRAALEALLDQGKVAR